jgi:maltose/moltooligosaccharide transporter
MVKKRLSLWQICNMSIGFMGIQFGWGLQMADMSAIYEYLGAEPDRLPILWLAAPLTGLIVQPFIGYMSDRTWGRLGRRRPYFLIGAILATLSLIVMPYSGVLWMAAGMLWVMDASVNVCMEPFRAFVADLLPEEQRTTGFTMQGVFIGLGAVTASSLPWLLEHVFNYQEAEVLTETVHRGSSIFQSIVPGAVRISFHIGAAALLICVLWTIFTTKEHPPEDMKAFNAMKKEKTNFWLATKEIFADLMNMPSTMKQLAWVQIFSWAGLFFMFLYFSVTVARQIFGGVEGSVEYLNGIKWAGICFAMYNAVCVFVSMALPSIARVIGKKYTHSLSLLCGAIGLLGIILVHDKNMLLVLMVGVGIAWASILSMPYAILSNAVPAKKMGVYMGIFNFFITIPEIVVSLGFGWVMSHFLGNNRILGLVAGGICLLIAAILTLRVREEPAKAE